MGGRGEEYGPARACRPITNRPRDWDVQTRFLHLCSNGPGQSLEHCGQDKITDQHRLCGGLYVYMCIGLWQN